MPWNSKATSTILITNYSTLGSNKHIQIVKAKSMRTASALSRLMSNVGGPRPVKRKLLTPVMHSQLLYAAFVWIASLVFDNHRRMLLSPQLIMALKIGREFRT